MLQEKFCNNGCLERFLKVKGDNVKKAAKQMRSCLAWRDSIGTGIFVSSLSFFVFIHIIFHFHFLSQLSNQTTLSPSLSLSPLFFQIFLFVLLFE